MLDSTCLNLDDLVDRARSGDEQAMTELFEQHRKRLRQMIRLRMDQRVQARDAVSDVLQEAFIDLAQQLPNYAKDPKLPFFLWLRRITGLRLAKVHRLHLGQEKRKVTREVRLDMPALPDASSVYVASKLIAPLTSASGNAIKVETQQQVEKAIEQLPPNDREVIAMRHVERLSNEEVSIILDVSTKAASMRYTRAMVRLRDLLDAIPGVLD